jgi:hypothetical protein
VTSWSFRAAPIITDLLIGLTVSSRSSGRALFAFADGFAVAGQVAGAIVRIAGITIAMAPVDAGVLSVRHCSLLNHRENFPRGPLTKTGGPSADF